MNDFNPPERKAGTKPKSVRYFGMTTTQIGILAGAAAVALLIVCGLSWFIFLQPASAPSAPPPAVKEIPPTPSPVVVTVVPTSSATPPPVIATSAPPGGWVEFTTRGATIWLPGSFVGGDLIDTKSETIQKINALGKLYKNAVDGVRNAKENVVLWMIDKSAKQTDIITTVTVEHAVSTEDTTIDQHIQNFLNGNVNGTPVAMLLTVNETKKMTVLGRETRRLTYSTYYVGHGATGLAYYIKDGANIWTVNYFLNPGEYLDLLPVVEQSMQTFYLVE